MKKPTRLLSAVLVLGLYAVGWATVLRVPSEYPTIQAGIDAAVQGDTVLVADGTYTGDGNRDLDFGSVNMIVMSEHGPEVTIIDCEGDSLDPHRGFYFHSGEDSGSVLQGFTIRDGYAAGPEPEDCGGGISCSYFSSPTIKGNVITGNTATRYGGGIFCDYSSPAIEGNSIIGNMAVWGGGIYCYDYSPSIKANLIVENTAVKGGGIGCFWYSSPHVISNTITRNAAAAGGGIHVDGWSYPAVRNCILWADSALYGQEISVDEVSMISVAYSNVEGGWPGTGNIDADPLFVTGPLGDYYLSQIAAGQVEDSPCVDAGDPSSAVPEGTTRTDHICDLGPVDMGYHYPECVVGVGDHHEEPPLTSPHYLVQNYRNPFRSSTVIAYSVEIPTQVTLTIYDIRGAMVRTLVSCRVSSAQHRTTWDGRDGQGRKVANGIYFCRLEAGERSDTRRMVLLR